MDFSCGVNRKQASASRAWQRSGLDVAYGTGFSHPPLSACRPTWDRVCGKNRSIVVEPSILGNIDPAFQIRGIRRFRWTGRKEGSSRRSLAWRSSGCSSWPDAVLEQNDRPNVRREDHAGGNATCNPRTGMRPEREGRSCARGRETHESQGRLYQKNYDEAANLATRPRSTRSTPWPGRRPTRTCHCGRDKEETTTCARNRADVQITLLHGGIGR